MIRIAVFVERAQALARALALGLCAGAMAASALAQGAPGASATPPSASPSTPACPASGGDLPTTALYGDWEARFDDIPGVAHMHLAKHPEYDGVRGTVSRAADAKGGAPVVSQVAGDIGDDGMLNLDESLDGQDISGVWVGELQPASCGRQFKGTWRNSRDDSNHSFTLDKTANSSTHP